MFPAPVVAKGPGTLTREATNRDNGKDTTAMGIWRETGEEHDARTWGRIDELLDEGRLRGAIERAELLGPEDAPQTARGARVRDRLSALRERLDGDLGALQGPDAWDFGAYYRRLEAIREYCVDDPQVNHLAWNAEARLSDPRLRAAVGGLADWLVPEDPEAEQRVSRWLRLALLGSLVLAMILGMIFGPGQWIAETARSSEYALDGLVGAVMHWLICVAPAVFLVRYVARVSLPNLVPMVFFFIGPCAVMFTMVSFGLHSAPVAILALAMLGATVVAFIQYRRVHLISEWNRFVVVATPLVEPGPDDSEEWDGGLLLLHEGGLRGMVRRSATRRCTVGPIGGRGSVGTLHLTGAADLPDGSWIAIDADMRVVAAAPKGMRKVAGAAGAGTVPPFGAPGRD